MPWRLIYWIVFAACLGVYAVMLIWTLPAISAGAGGLAPFDLRLGGYSAEEARAFLAALSDDARALYLGPQQLLDLFYPALLAVVLGGAIWALVPWALLRWVLLGAVLVGMAGDYVENARVAALLRYDGAVPAEMVAAASRATLVKSAATTVAMLGALAGLARLVWMKWSGSS